MIKLNYEPGSPPVDPEQFNAAIQDVFAKGSILIFHPSGTVWQIIGCNVEGGSVALIDQARSNVIETMDQFGITDERVSTLTPNA